MALVQRAVIEHRQQLRRGVTELELCIQMEQCALKTLGEMVCEQPVVKFWDVDFD